MSNESKKLHLTRLDRLISYFSPARGEKRMKHKIRSSNMERKYNGAMKSGRLSSWLPTNGDADSEILNSLPTLRARSRDLCRNNPHAVAAISELANNIVGTGISVRFDHEDRNYETEIKKVWKSWVETKDCDFERMAKFRGLQYLAVKAWLESGEVFIRTRVERAKAFPISYHVLESDQLADFYNDGNKVQNGIEYDSQGRRVAYYFYKDHPGNTTKFSTNYETVRIPASEIKHIFFRERPGQSRGVPFLKAILIKLNDLDEFEDAEIVRQKIASCFSAFVKDMEPGDDLKDEDDYELGEKMSPGLIEFLPPGKDITFANPGTKEGYKEFMNTGLHSVATGANITYEGLTGDYSQTNYSSAKAGNNKFQRAVRVFQKLIMIDLFIDDVVSDFKRWMPFVGLYNTEFEHYFTPPRVEMIDPLKDTKALNGLVRSGFKAWQDAVSELGEDPDELLRKKKVDRDRFKELDLILDSDANATQSNGNLHTLDEIDTSTEED